MTGEFPCAVHHTPYVTSSRPLIFRGHQSSIDLSRHLGENLCSITLHVHAPCALYKRTQGDSAPYLYIISWRLVSTVMLKYQWVGGCQLTHTVGSITLTWSHSILADKGLQSPKHSVTIQLLHHPASCQCICICIPHTYMPIYSILYQHTFICNNRAPSDCMHQHIHTRRRGQ